MTRLLITTAWDTRLQIRNGFYYAAALMIAMWVPLLRLLPDSIVPKLLPPLILGNLVINTFYFVGALVLLEKREGTLQAQVVTPLRTWEYLAAKVASLTLLSLVENVLIVVAVFGMRVNLAPIVLGIVAASTMFTLAGFVAVARYESINEYLLPSMLYVIVFTLPLASTFVGWDHWIFYLHPLQAPLVLLQAGFQPEPAWRWLYGILYSLVWVAPAYYWTRTAFNRHIIARQGAVV